jgi:ribonuclease P protein component
LRHSSHGSDRAGRAYRHPYTASPREADLSAEEAQARSDARISRPDADAERPRDHQAPSPQGSQAADAVSKRPRRGRLSRSGDFDRVYREGRSHANRFLVIYAFPREGERGEDEVRLGISVSRKVGGAVQRTTVKRVLREAFWDLQGTLPPGHDFVVVARPDAGGLLERDGRPGIAGALRELIADAGLGEGRL